MHVQLITILNISIVPPFDVSISQDYNDPLYTGTPLTITCDITLSSLVDIPVNVTTDWTRNGTEITQNTITDTLMNNNLSYTASLDFYPISYLTDDGIYQCLFNIAPSSDVEYVDTISNRTSTELNVLGKYIRLTMYYSHHIQITCILQIYQCPLSVYQDHL